jgi:uncharacterized protein
MRYTKTDLVAAAMAKASGLKYIVEQPLIANSFRKAAKDMGVPSIVFEGGESIRLDRLSIHTGLISVKNILHETGMLPNHTHETTGDQYLIKKEAWIRSSTPGMFIWYKKSGDYVEAGQELGEINDPFGTKSTKVVSPVAGHIIGHNNASVVTLGDALFHVGTIWEKV